MCTLFIDTKKLYASLPNLKREDVQILQEWVKKQPHLPQLTELHLIICLLFCHNSVEASKSQIDIYFTRRTQYLHIFERLSKEDVKTTLSTTALLILPKETPGGYVILLGKLLDTKAENFNFSKCIRLLDMVSCLHVYELAPINGAVIVFDAKGFSLAHLAKFNLYILKHSLDHLQEAAPVEIKGIHIVNANAILDKALVLIKPFLSNELFNLIHIHSSLDTFFKYVPKNCLPEDYDGELPSCKILQEKMLDHLLENYDYFVWNDSLTVDESKRLDKKNVFGVDGTFKKLEID